MNYGILKLVVWKIESRNGKSKVEIRNWGV
jgi:hypothetical protein